MLPRPYKVSLTNNSMCQESPSNIDILNLKVKNCNLKDNKNVNLVLLQVIL